MNILHVVRGLTNSSGTTHIVGPLAEEQARLGHRVAVYFVDKPPYEAVTPDKALVRSQCFPVTALRGHPGISIAFARALDRDVRDFDLVHVHAVWNFPSCYAMRAAGRAGVPYMVAPQGSLEPWALAAGSPVRRAYAARIEGPLMRRATRMQALTGREAEQIRAFGIGVPVSIIPNGVGGEWLALPRGSLAEDLGLPGGERTLLYLSRVHPKKRLDRLLHGFAAFAAEVVDVTLVIAGDDAGSGHLEEMQRLAAELGLGERCRFIGEASGEHKRRTLAGATAFALTSESEGLPVAAVEAMASSLPVLVTPGCNLPEVAEADAGMVVAPDPAAVTVGLRALFADPEALRRRGANGRRLVGERFTWPSIARESLDGYRLMTAAQHHARAA